MNDKDTSKNTEGKTRTGRFSDKRCPKCGATLLTNDYDDYWCSRVPSGNTKGCDYGMKPDQPTEVEYKSNYYQTFSKPKTQPAEGAELNYSELVSNVFEYCKGHMEYTAKKIRSLPGHQQAEHYLRYKVNGKIQSLTKSLKESEASEVSYFEKLSEVEAENERLKDNFKKSACRFFRWWWNQPGTNTEQGFDEWFKTEFNQTPK